MARFVVSSELCCERANKSHPHHVRVLCPLLCFPVRQFNTDGCSHTIHSFGLMLMSNHSLSIRIFRLPATAMVDTRVTVIGSCSFVPVTFPRSILPLQVPPFPPLSSTSNQRKLPIHPPPFLWILLHSIIQFYRETQNLRSHVNPRSRNSSPPNFPRLSIVYLLYLVSYYHFIHISMSFPCPLPAALSHSITYILHFGLPIVPRTSIPNALKVFQSAFASLKLCHSGFCSNMHMFIECVFFFLLSLSIAERLGSVVVFTPTLY